MSGILHRVQRGIVPTGAICKQFQEAVSDRLEALVHGTPGKCAVLLYR